MSERPSSDANAANPAEQTPSNGRAETNRQNAQKSTGPRTATGKLAVSQNATKHGLLSKALRFQDASEKTEFQQLLEDLRLEFQPLGRWECMLVEEIAVCHWKITVAEGWVQEELLLRRKAATAILDVLLNCSDSAGNPFSKQQDEVRNAAQGGLDCRELVIKVGGNEQPGQRVDEIFPDKKKTSVQFEARLCSSTGALSRYVTTWKRDLYKALSTLREMQRARKAAGGTAAGR